MGMTELTPFHISFCIEADGEDEREAVQNAWDILSQMAETPIAHACDCNCSDRHHCDRGKWVDVNKED